MFGRFNPFRRSPSTEIRPTAKFRPQVESLGERLVPNAATGADLFSQLRTDLSHEYADSIKGDPAVLAQDQSQVAADVQAIQGQIRVGISELITSYNSQPQDAKAQLQGEYVALINQLASAYNSVQSSVNEMETGMAYVSYAVEISNSDPGYAGVYYQYGVEALTKGVSDYSTDPNLDTAQTVLSVLSEQFGQVDPNPHPSNATVISN
jgi:hypothetical protein